MKSALLCLDLQYLVAARDSGIFSDENQSGMGVSEREYYFQRLENQVLPNVQALQAEFRDKGLEVIHVHVMSQTSDGRERTWSHRHRNVHCAPGSKEAEFIQSVAPLEDEITIGKTAVGPFGNSNIHALLHQLEIRQLYCCGVFTDLVVESTIRAAADFGYHPVLIEDATATRNESVQRECVDRLGAYFCRVVTTAELVEDLQQHLRSVP